MRSYKAEVTLNEKDSLNDLLSAEKQLLKLYATVMTESVSKGMRDLVKACIDAVTEDQIKVFFMMTERGYYTVSSAKEEKLSEIREKFLKEKSQLA